MKVIKTTNPREVLQFLRAQSSIETAEQVSQFMSGLTVDEKLELLMYLTSNNSHITMQIIQSMGGSIVETSAEVMAG